MRGGFQHASNGEIQLGSVDFSGGRFGGGGSVGFGGERSDGERLADRRFDGGRFDGRRFDGGRLGVEDLLAGAGGASFSGGRTLNRVGAKLCWLVGDGSAAGS